MIALGADECICATRRLPKFQHCLLISQPSGVNDLMCVTQDPSANPQLSSTHPDGVFRSPKPLHNPLEWFFPVPLLQQCIIFRCPQCFLPQFHAQPPGMSTNRRYRPPELLSKPCNRFLPIPSNYQGILILCPSLPFSLAFALQASAWRRLEDIRSFDDG